MSRQWNPYVDNGGTVMGIAGDDYVIIAGDTRMSNGYTIQSRNVTKLLQLHPHAVIASAGQQCDRDQLHKILQARLRWYEHQHDLVMPAPAMAQLLSNTLYYRRFFPYYTFNILAGLDEEGKGALWGYDAIGSFERLPAAVCGSSQELCSSLLDNQVEFKQQLKNKKKLSQDQALDLLKDIFTSAGERDIYTGDNVEIYIITLKGTRKLFFELKKD